MATRNYYSKPGRLDDMVGKTFTSVEGKRGDEYLKFVAPEGDFVFFHDSDCCESVDIEDIDGDLEDLVGSPLVMAEEVSSEDAPTPEHTDSFTWTYYKFATVKGYVTVRWLGQSNGYYSEDVCLAFYPA